MTAKVIILSQNPGYDEGKGDVIPLMIKQMPDMAGKVMDFYRDTLNLKAKGFMPEDKKEPNGLSVRDMINAMQSWYWEPRLRHLQNKELGITEDSIYKDIALIQYVAYHSITFADFSKDTMLPSQKFTKELIEYIESAHKDTVFVVMRAQHYWEKLLGKDMWERLKVNKRIIMHKENCFRPQHLSPKCLGEKSFERIVDLLK